MKTTKSMVVVSVFCMLLLSSSASIFPSQGFSSDVTAEDIRRITEDGKEPYLAAIVMDYLIHQGKTDATETVITETPIANLIDLWNPDSDIYKKNLNHDHVIVFGEPFQIYTIKTEDILNYDENVDISSIQIPSNIWNVAVYIYNRPSALLIVGYQDGKWEVEGAGLGDVSESMDIIQKMCVTCKNKKSTFVRINSIGADFIITDKYGKKMIHPFSYTIKLLKLDDRQVNTSGLFDVPYFMSKLTKSVVNKEIIR